MASGAWVFPKVIIDPGDTAPGTALKESVEEAGLHGVLRPDPLGCYEYSWHEQITLTVEVYLLEVTRIDDTWDDMELRTRRWCEETESRELLRDHPGFELFLKGLDALRLETEP